jgi:hypothetical protein
LSLSKHSSFCHITIIATRALVAPAIYMTKSRNRGYKRHEIEGVFNAHLAIGRLSFLPGTRVRPPDPQEALMNQRQL